VVGGGGWGRATAVLLLEVLRQWINWGLYVALVVGVAEYLQGDVHSLAHGSVRDFRVRTLIGYSPELQRRT